MALIIVKIGDRYGLWSTGCDAPASTLGTREELKALLREDAMRDFEREFEERMARVDAKGTSSHLDDSAESVMRLNRCGPREGCVPVKKVIEKWERDSDEEDAALHPPAEGEAPSGTLQSALLSRAARASVALDGETCSAEGEEEE